MIQTTFRNAPNTSKIERIDILTRVTAEILNAVREIESDTGAAVVAVSLEIDYSKPQKYTVLDGRPAAVCDVLTGDGFTDCEHCDGTGKTSFTEYWESDGSPAGTGHGHPVTFTEDCEPCDGTGVIDATQCTCGDKCELPHRTGACSRCGGAV